MDNKKIKVIESKKDAIIFLNQMIILVDKRMTRFKRSISDLHEELSHYDENTKKIRTEIYHRHSERIECLSNYLFNLFGDETKTAVSYKQFRNILEKKVKQGHKEFQLDELESEIVTLLNEFRDMRNWSHHVPQSVLNSQLEYMKERAGLPSDFVEFNFSNETIAILTWEYHDITWLSELYKSVSELYQKFSRVFQRMKKDYSKLIGTSMNIIREQQPIARPYDFKMIGENSYLINVGKKK
ncbi:MAG: hypothetical protein ACOWWO_18645 [Peptococcaceae bacterium]